MRPLTAAAIRGTWATVLLPLGEDDQVLWEELEEQLERILAAGVDGVYTNGSAGEFWAQTENEFDRLSALVAAGCERAGVPFQLGAAYPSPQVALDRLRRARDHAPGAIQVILPDWFIPSDAEGVAFLERMAAEASPVPLVLYNPPHAKRVLTPAELDRLCAAVPAIAGLKVGGGDAGWYRVMRPLLDRVSVFVPGHHLASGHRQGAAGSYSNVACLNPRGAVAWWETMRRDPDAALAVEARLRAFLDECVIPLQRDRGYCNAALDKLLAAVGGWCPLPTRLRWPYACVPDADVAGVRAAAATRLPEFVEAE